MLMDYSCDWWNTSEKMVNLPPHYSLERNCKIMIVLYYIGYYQKAFLFHVKDDTQFIVCLWTLMLIWMG